MNDIFAFYTELGIDIEALGSEHFTRSVIDYEVRYPEAFRVRDLRRSVIPKYIETLKAAADYRKLKQSIISHVIYTKDLPDIEELLSKSSVLVQGASCNGVMLHWDDLKDVDDCKRLQNNVGEIHDILLETNVSVTLAMVEEAFAAAPASSELAMLVDLVNRILILSLLPLSSVLEYHSSQDTMDAKQFIVYESSPPEMAHPYKWCSDAWSDYVNRLKNMLEMHLRKQYKIDTFDLIIRMW